MDFAIERSQGFASVLFHLGLKQSLKTTNFFLIPKNHYFRRTYFSKEYAYLLTQGRFPDLASAPKASKDWFYGRVEPHRISIFLLESLFRKHQRRFWRLRLKGAGNRHLRLESSFFLSALSLHSAGSLEGDLPYQGPESSSYHFSFFSNSLDRRSQCLSPVMFFHYKYKHLLSFSLYRFSLKINFRRMLSKPSFSFLSHLTGYIDLCLKRSLSLFCYYYLLL